MVELVSICYTIVVSGADDKEDSTTLFFFFDSCFFKRKVSPTTPMVSTLDFLGALKLRSYYLEPFMRFFLLS